MDYSGPLAIIVAALKADSALTAFLATRTIGNTSSKANSILYSNVIGEAAYPCLIVRDMGPQPIHSQLHELPMAACLMQIEIAIVATSQARRPIQGRLDYFLEYAHWSRVLDTTDWHIEDIDTSGGWINLQLPKQTTLDAFGDLEMAVKTYTVQAAAKTLP